jgi:hypothetical protein
MSALVIEDSFYVPRLNAKFGHASGAGAPEVVQAPVCNGQTLIKLLFGATKDIETPFAKDELR